MNAFKARESDLRQHLQTMASRPDIRHLMTYVDAAVSLAEFAEERGLECPNCPPSWAAPEPLTPEFRRILERGFKAEVFDKYGSRECCDMACECRHHTGLHVFSPNVYLEIVDDQGIAVPAGETGRILVTLLNNLSFPMIRYEIGDLGKWAPARLCPCGSPFPLIESLQGRQDDMLTTEDGTRQSSSFVRHFVGVSLNRQLIREWQLEQTGPTTFVFRFRPETPGWLGPKTWIGCGRVSGWFLADRLKLRCGRWMKSRPAPPARSVGSSTVAGSDRRGLATKQSSPRVCFLHSHQRSPASVTSVASCSTVASRLPLRQRPRHDLIKLLVPRGG